MECPICYTEIIPEANCAITSCKHTFCTKCFISSVLHNNLCPCCRSELYEKTDSDNEDEYSANTGTEYRSDSESIISRDIPYDNYNYDDEPIASMEDIACIFEQKGYTILDLMQLVIPQRYYSDPNNANTYSLIADAINDSIEKADFDAKISHYERQIMENEDRDTYH